MQELTCPFVAADYTARVRKTIGILFLLAATTVQAADNSTSNCLARLDQLVEEVSALEQSATADATRAACVTDQRNKIKSLNELAHTFFETMNMHLAEKNFQAADDDQAMLQTACTRAEKLMRAALECQGSTLKNYPFVLVTNPASALPAKIRAMPVIPLGDETTCLKHAKFALLLVRAMGLEADDGVNAMQVLTKQEVAPLTGWHTESCITLGDFCVVIAKVLHLKITAPGEVASYIQAVRNDGLPVDSLMAHQPQEVLRESAVRTFLADGYAAPLPSSRRLQPE